MTCGGSRFLGSLSDMLWTSPSGSCCCGAVNDNWFSLHQLLLCFLLTSSMGAADEELILVLAGMGRVEVLWSILQRDIRM